MGPFEKKSETARNYSSDWWPGISIVLIVSGIIGVLGTSYGLLFARTTDFRTSMLEGHYQVAFTMAKSAANGGDEAAQNTIGNLYYLGLGVKRDYRRAHKWYLKAALEGYGPAQANLGHLYSQGLGVPKDTIMTIGWYWLAWQGGYKPIKRRLRRTREENHFNALMVEKAKSLFSSLDKVKKRYAKQSQARSRAE